MGKLDGFPLFTTLNEKCSTSAFPAFFFHEAFFAKAQNNKFMKWFIYCYAQVLFLTFF